MTDRFHAPEPPRDGRVTLDGDEARHLALVLRKRPGDRVEVFDGRGHAYPAEVRAVGKGAAELAIVGPARVEPPPRVSLTLASAVPKGERFDWLVEKATELGVARLVPLQADRSVVRPKPAKLERLRRAVVEASKQCGRDRLMEVGPLTIWDDLLGEEVDAERLVADPSGAEGLAAVPRSGRIALAIGPEGGFTAAELDAARGAGWRVVRLGATILRIETAALAGAAALLLTTTDEEG